MERRRLPEVIRAGLQSLDLLRFWTFLLFRVINTFVIMDSLPASGLEMTSQAVY